jgi:hypothetical protein
MRSLRVDVETAARITERELFLLKMFALRTILVVIASNTCSFFSFLLLFIWKLHTSEPFLKVFMEPCNVA